TLKITKFGPDPVVINFALENGKLSAQGGGTVQVERIYSKLKGEASVDFDSASDKLKITGKDITFADPALEGKAVVKNFDFDYGSGVVKADIVLDNIGVTAKGVHGHVKKGELHLDGDQISGEVDGSITVGGAAVEAKIGYNNGEFEFKGGKITLKLGEI